MFKFVAAAVLLVLVAHGALAVCPTTRINTIRPSTTSNATIRFATGTEGEACLGMNHPIPISYTSGWFGVGKSGTGGMAGNGNPVVSFLASRAITNTATYLTIGTGAQNVQATTTYNISQLSASVAQGQFVMFYARSDISTARPTAVMWAVGPPGQVTNFAYHGTNRGVVCINWANNSATAIVSPIAAGISCCNAGTLLPQGICPPVSISSSASASTSTSASAATSTSASAVTSTSASAATTSGASAATTSGASAATTTGASAATTTGASASTTATTTASASTTGASGSNNEEGSAASLGAVFSMVLALASALVALF